MIEIFVYFDRKKIQGISFISHAYQMMNEEKEKERKKSFNRRFRKHSFERKAIRTRRDFFFLRLVYRFIRQSQLAINPIVLSIFPLFYSLSP